MALLEQKVVAFAVSPSKTAAPWFKFLFCGSDNGGSDRCTWRNNFCGFCQVWGFFGFLNPDSKSCFCNFCKICCSWIMTEASQRTNAFLETLEAVPAFPLHLLLLLLHLLFLLHCGGAMPATADFHFFLKHKFLRFFRWKEQQQKKKWLCAGIAVWSEFWLFWWFRWCFKGDLVIFFGARPAAVWAETFMPESGLASKDEI